MIIFTAFSRIVSAISVPIAIGLLWISGAVMVGNPIVTLAICLIATVIGIVPLWLFVSNYGWASVFNGGLRERTCLALFNRAGDSVTTLCGPQFVDGNDEAIRVLELSSRAELAELQPQNISPEFQPNGQASADAVPEKIGTAIETGYNRFEWEHLSVNGNRLPVSVTLITERFGGKDYLHNIWHDISDLVDSRAEQERLQEQNRQAMVDLAEELASSVGSATATVSDSIVGLTELAQSMAATAEETSQQSATVASASEEASANVQTVASAAEELSSSISEISRQVGQSSEISSNAVRQAEETNEKVQGLAEAANKIGEVVALITDIADQTNLLALNATIEAARAGDAGKGFAVVASEVKNLANQTGKATDEIGNQIAEIQAATSEAVTAIEAIGKTISEVDEIASTIASAVEQQGAATQEIARNVEQAAAGTQEVSSNIDGVNQAASDTGTAATKIQTSAAELSQQSDRLRSEIDEFLVKVRAA